MTPTDCPVRENDILAGKYRVEKVIGLGGMGVVVAAEHIQLSQRVAVKFLLPHACKSPDAVARFLREARAAVRIQSEHVARVTDVGTLDDTGAPYMVMEFLKGSDLSSIVRERGKLPVPDAIDYVLQACEAIAEAHAAGIIHRDLKPANLFLTQRADGSGLVKVLDFGISKASLGEPQQQSLTSTGTTMGSPLYMSPEQVRDAKTVDIRTDIWALGAILFELVAGRTVYEADTLPSLIAMIISDAPSKLQDLCPEIPEGFSSVVEKCLQKKVEDRYSTVGELAIALSPFASSGSRLSIDRILGVLGTRSASPAATTSPCGEPSTTASSSPSFIAPAWGTTMKQAPKRSRIAVAGLVFCVIVTAGAFFGVLRPRLAATKAGPIGRESETSTQLTALASPPSVASVPVVVASAGDSAATAPTVQLAVAKAPSAVAKEKPKAPAEKVSKPAPAKPAVTRDPLADP